MFTFLVALGFVELSQVGLGGSYLSYGRVGTQKGGSEVTGCECLLLGVSVPQVDGTTCKAFSLCVDSVVV